jgi:hypothetical protein
VTATHRQRAVPAFAAALLAAAASLLAGARAASAQPAAAPAAAPAPPPPLTAPVAQAAPPSLAAPPPPAEAAPATDHDTVVGHYGIQARRIVAGPLPLALRPGLGCPAAVTTPCTVDMGAVSVRYWKTRNLAVDVGVALAGGGGRDGSTTLDSYLGLGPIVGINLLLGNWRHLAIEASPQLGFIVFKPALGGSGAGSGATKLVDLRTELEGELHFGFVGVPALSVGVAAGLVFQYESTPGASVWSVTAGQANSVWGTLTNLFLRYYL